MIWALDKNEDRITASPGLTATCPMCQKNVIAKCGSIVSWHWAHEANQCDQWSEPETDWHIQWKSRFPKDWQEVIIGDHRADVFTPANVIEFQRSYLSEEVIYQRESHYGEMIWVLCGGDFINQLDIRWKETHVTFRWKHPRKSWFYSTKPIYIDSCSGWLLKVKKIYPNIPCGGWGTLIPVNDFISHQMELAGSTIGATL